MLNWFIFLYNAALITHKWHYNTNCTIIHSMSQTTILQEDKFKFIDVGEGDTIVLLHGLFGALSNFGDLINHFSKQYRVVVPMLPIYDLPFRKATIGNLVKHVEEFIVFKELNNFVILGNSLGGHISLLYTKNNQERVRAMVLTGSSGLFENAMGGTFPKRKNYEFIKKKTEFTFYDPSVATKELIDEVFETVNSKERGIKIVTVAKSAIRHNMRNNLPDLKVPCLLIWGKQDQITPPFVAEEFNELLPNSELHFIDLCGHAPMMEHPQQFNAILDDYLTRL